MKKLLLLFVASSIVIGGYANNGKPKLKKLIKSSKKTKTQVKKIAKKLMCDEPVHSVGYWITCGGGWQAPGSFVSKKHCVDEFGCHYNFTTTVDVSNSAGCYD